MSSRDTESLSPAGSQGAFPRKWFQRIGPALITACVVIGPGSIMTSSNVGAKQGYSMGWVVVCSVIFMLVYMTMGARLGVATGKSASSVITERAGRWLAVAIGLSVFFISAAFQFGNNLGVHYALSTYINSDYLIVVFNALAIGFLLFFKDMYRLLEKLMMVFVGIMLIAFAVNLGFSGPRLGELFSGFVPTKGAFGDLSVLGLIGTTFVTTAAFYQSYLVRQKGWGSDDLNAGMIDVRVGASIMALITLMLMFTPATMFHPAYQHQQIVTFPEVGHPFLDATSQKEADAQVDAMDSENLSVLALDLPGESKEYKELHSELRDSWYVVPKSEIDLANSGLPADRQATFAKRGFTDLTEVGFALKPLFGGFGPPLFFLGVFAAAYSSFLVNSMIGGFMLSDGLGIGDSPDGPWPKRFTILVLLVGMCIGLYTIVVLEGIKPVELIVAAQAVTVLASPLVAGSLLWLTSSKKVMGEHVNGPILITLGLIGFLLLIAMSLNLAINTVFPKAVSLLSASP